MKLIISGIGMMTSVGHDAQTACASMRAGIMRAGPIEHMTVTDEDTHKATPIVGCTLSPMTDGFSNVARWSIIGQYAIQDLIRYAQLPNGEDKSFWQKTAIVFATPDLSSPTFMLGGIIKPDTAKAIYALPFLVQAGLPIPENNCFIVEGENTAVIKANTLIKKLLNTGTVERVIVIAADTHVDAQSLSYLDLVQRIKTPDNPVGLMPSEAAVALLYETEEAISQRGVKALARIYAHSTGIEPNNIISDEVNTGKALAITIKQTLNTVQLQNAYNGEIYSDLNGEEWRAQEFVLAKANVSRDILSEQAEEILPAASLGDIGVVNAACSLCMLIESKQRGYTRSASALILASGSMGEVGCMLVQAL